MRYPIPPKAPPACYHSDCAYSTCRYAKPERLADGECAALADVIAWNACYDFEEAERWAFEEPMAVLAHLAPLSEVRRQLRQDGNL